MSTSRLAQLQEAWDPDLAEQLDQDFQRAAFSAAKSVDISKMLHTSLSMQISTRKRMSSNISYLNIVQGLTFP